MDISVRFRWTSFLNVYFWNRFCATFDIRNARTEIWTRLIVIAFVTIVASLQKPKRQEPLDNLSTDPTVVTWRIVLHDKSASNTRGIRNNELSRQWRLIALAVRLWRKILCGDIPKRGSLGGVLLLSNFAAQTIKMYSSSISRCQQSKDIISYSSYFYDHKLNGSLNRIFHKNDWSTLLPKK